MGSKHLGSYKWKQQRLLVLRRDCYICAYCGEAANEVDHIQPRVLGGTDDFETDALAERLSKGEMIDYNAPTWVGLTKKADPKTIRKGGFQKTDSDEDSDFDG